MRYNGKRSDHTGSRDGNETRPLTDTNHKCLTEVNGVPILLNALKVLNNNKFSRVILVVGYLREQIKEVIGDAYQNMKIEYAVNSIYSKTNTSYSLELGLEKITEKMRSIFLKAMLCLRKSSWKT